MKTIPNFRMYGMKEAITLYDNQKGILQFHYTIPLSLIQQQALFDYLVAEGFIKVPDLPEDDYELHWQG